MEKKRTLAIIGIGPRGAYAFENLILALEKVGSLAQIQILLFEETGNFGNGHVYDIDQAQTNWININERALEITGRREINTGDLHIPSFPSYHEWIKCNFDEAKITEADRYPSRSKMGKYLLQRFESIASVLKESDVATLHIERVERVEVKSDQKISLITGSSSYRDIDEILLTIGHQETEESDQIKTWYNYASKLDNVRLFKSPYPISTFLTSMHLNEKSVVGIRGFGLAMIDAARGIASKYGTFIVEDETTKSCKYEPQGDVTGMLVPFSLDGLPPAPKPLNAQIDNWFKPTEAQLVEFEQSIEGTDVQKEAKSPLFLINAFAPMAAKIYMELPQAYLQNELSQEQVENLIRDYLQHESYAHPTIISHSQSAVKTMQCFVGMATGLDPISLDFCIGQVWRHCQPSIYDKLSHNSCSDEVFSEIIKLDEGTKRYSYGPPVESIQQMIALVEAKVMDLSVVTNPAFKLEEKGWCMTTNNKSITVDTMIDSVLDSPKIKAVNSSLVRGLLSNEWLEAVHHDLGVHTDENGYVVSKNKSIEVPIALLGRLAKGTVIGVDAILECYGTRPREWAKHAAHRHAHWISKSG